MAVSSVGQRMSAATLRHVVATVAVAVALFSFLHGPPLTDRLTQAAHRECNRVTGADYRSYRLEWRTTTLFAVSRPHWVCHELGGRDRPGRNLGWWVGV